MLHSRMTAKGSICQRTACMMTSRQSAGLPRNAAGITVLLAIICARSIASRMLVGISPAGSCVATAGTFISISPVSAQAIGALVLAQLTRAVLFPFAQQLVTPAPALLGCE